MRELQNQSDYCPLFSKFNCDVFRATPMFMCIGHTKTQ